MIKGTPDRLFARAEPQRPPFSNSAIMTSTPISFCRLCQKYRLDPEAFAAMMMVTVWPNILNRASVSTHSNPLGFTANRTDGRICLWTALGTSYIPPVKPILIVHDYEGLRISRIFGNTPPPIFRSFLRRILLPKNEPALDRYDYPAYPCGYRENCRSSLIQALGSASEGFGDVRALGTEGFGALGTPPLRPIKPIF